MKVGRGHEPFPPCVLVATGFRAHFQAPEFLAMQASYVGGGGTRASIHP